MGSEVWLSCVDWWLDGTANPPLPQQLSLLQLALPLLLLLLPPPRVGPARGGVCAAHDAGVLLRACAGRS